ncbi:MAG: DNA polymerase IV [Bifidobacteriaceae bacterium]|nr:DNA polymerase IV [Bifidobacteriaceae bacterium]
MVPEERSILHVDMDSFFASVELRRRPDLVGRAVIVGGEGRSVVLTATYEARAFGVSSGMAMTSARRACPHATVIPPDYRAYAVASRQVMAILREVTPLMEQVSVDEAYLDVTGSLRRLGPPRAIGESIRRRVRDDLSLACSVGIGTSKAVAKIASTRAKPDGLMEVPSERTIAFLHALPVSALSGVGAKTAKALAAFGIATVADVAATPDVVLRRAVGQAWAEHLAALASGRDPRQVTPRREEKSIGAETTFVEDLPRGDHLDAALLALADKAAHRMRSAGLACHTVAIKVRTADFTTVSRSRTLPGATNLTKTVVRAARDLLAAVDLRGMPVRLVGVRLEQLVSPERMTIQPTLDGDDTDDAERQVQAAGDAIRGRFGTGALRPASLLPDATGFRS